MLNKIRAQLHVASEGPVFTSSWRGFVEIVNIKSNELLYCQRLKIDVRYRSVDRSVVNSKNRNRYVSKQILYSTVISSSEKQRLKKEPLVYIYIP